MVHGLAIVAGWLLFFWGWHRVLSGTPDFSELRLLMIGAAIVVPVVTLSWILHNRGIHRRKGPRRSVPAATLAYGVDFNGREIVADFRSLARAQRVRIFIDGSRKLYQQDLGGAAYRSHPPVEAEEAAHPEPPAPAPGTSQAAATGDQADTGASPSPPTAGSASRPVAAAGETANDRDTRPHQ